MRNSKTILLRVDVTDLAPVSSGSSGINARMQSVFYNSHLTTSEKKIEGFAAYLSTDDS